ncbi:MAG: hypothetical protein ROM54_12785 [Anaerobiospirillum sp.]|nr:hypothetical protein [Anaerobiospirillum sp.]
MKPMTDLRSNSGLHRDLAAQQSNHSTVDYDYAQVESCTHLLKH